MLIFIVCKSEDELTYARGIFRSMHSYLNGRHISFNHSVSDVELEQMFYNIDILSLRKEMHIVYVSCTETLAIKWAPLFAKEYSQKLVSTLYMGRNEI